jgi:hypothetical protein
MSYKGKYQPKNPQKYRGNVNNIIYRSLWERKFLVYCDTSDNIIEYASEEIALPYRSPIDNKIHKYFPDFYIKVRESNGEIKKYIIEIKPKKQTIEPIPQKKKTKGYIYEVYEYARNQAKWKAAIEYCKDRQWEFKIFTETDLGIK